MSYSLKCQLNIFWLWLPWFAWLLVLVLCKHSSHQRDIHFFLPLSQCHLQTLPLSLHHGQLCSVDHFVRPFWIWSFVTSVLFLHNSHVRDIILYLYLPLRRILPSIMSLNSMPVVANCMILSFLDWVVFHCVYTSVFLSPVIST